MRKILLLLFAFTLAIAVKSQQLVVDSITFTLNPGANCTRIGDFTAHVTGGTPHASGLPYDYYWYEIVYNSTTNNYDTVALNLPADSIANDLPPGDYQVRVADIVPDTVKNLFSSLPAVIFSTSSDPVSCYGGSDGSIGSEHNDDIVSYLWSNGRTNDTLLNIAAGVYTVLVTNVDGCQATFSQIVYQPDSLYISSSVSLTCNFNTLGRRIAVDLSISGGSPDGIGIYYYSWTGPAGFTATSQDIVNNYADDGGAYNIRVTDGNGCTKDTSFVLVPYQHLFASGYQYTITNPTCYAASNGSVLVNQFGGTPPYSCLWGEGGSPNTFTATNFITGLVENAYYLYNLSDSIGCIKNLITPLEFDLLQPPQLTGSLSVMDVQCNDSSTGSINLTVNGGTPYLATGIPTYHYYWSNGPVNTATIGNLHAGSYSVVAIDSLGCAITKDTTIINMRPPITTPNTHFNLRCNSLNEGWIKLNVSGGEPPYQYQWTGPMAFIPGNNTDSVYNLAPGMYYVTVTDEFLCTKSDSVLLTQPTLIQSTAVSTNVTCAGGNNGTASVTASGGTPNYTYYWSSTNGFTANTAAVSNLFAGDYSSYVTDANGCEVLSTVTITSNTAIAIGGLAIDPACSGTCDGKIILSLTGTVTGGVAPYKFMWNLWNNSTDTIADITGLCAGKDSVTVTDTLGCFTGKMFDLVDPLPVLLDLGPDRILCDTQKLRLNIELPDPANYTWSGPNNFTASTGAVTLTDAGTYYAVINTSPNGCVATDDIVIGRNSGQVSSEFLISTQAFKGKTVTIVNISDPMPDSIHWLIPSSPNISMLSSTDRILELMFSDTGKYVIGMKAYTGPCEETSEQDVIVVEPEPFNGIVEEEALIREFIVYPNPVDFTFNVRIKLKEISKIRLRLYNLNTSALSYDSKNDTRIINNPNTPSDTYELDYTLLLASGMYVMVLETPKGNMLYKIIKN